jgi:protein-disulfide isomerase
VDPQGKLTDDVKADYALGEKVGLDHTPTIFIVTDGRNSAQQFQEVTDRSKMDAMLQAAIQQVGGIKEAAAATAKSAAHHKSGN